MTFQTSDKKLKKVALIGIITITFGMAIATLIGDKIKNREKDTDNEFTSTDQLTDFSYATMKVTDYKVEANELLKEEEWESRYSLITRSATLYVNSVPKNDVVLNSTKEVVTFMPEEKTEVYDYEEKMKENDTGILYQMSLSECEEYVASLMQNGCILRRKILTPTYAEVYLFNEAGNTVRVLAFTDKMLMAEIDTNELPSIESYFEIRN